MGDIRTSIILDLAGNLQSQSRKLTRELERMGNRGTRSVSRLNRVMRVTDRGLNALGNRYTALFTGAAGIGALKMVGDLEERFTRLGIQANRSAWEIDFLKKQIYDVAKAPDVRVDPGRITSAIEEIVEKTGDLSYARENIRGIGLALQAAGADGRAIGGILAEFQKMGLTGPESFQALDLLTAQGKAGAFTLQNLAALGPRVVTAYTAMGRTGLPAIREMGAALQVIRQGTGSSEMAATAFEALLRSLGDANKVKLLRRGGIRIFEKGSTTVMRALPEIMEEIIRKTRGSKMVLSKIFDAEAIRAFNAAAGEFQRTGSLESLQRFYNIQADGSALTRDASRAADTFNAALAGLNVVWKEFADEQLAEPIKDLTEALDGLKPGTVKRWLEMGKNVSIVGGGLWLARKAKVPAAMAIPLAPAGLAAGGAYLADKAGRAIAQQQYSFMSPERLREEMARTMVMGGGAGTPQYKMMEAELNRKMSGEIKLHISHEPGMRVRTEGLAADSGLDIEVDTGPTMWSAH